MKKILYLLFAFAILVSVFCSMAYAEENSFDSIAFSTQSLSTNYDYYLHINGTTYIVPNGTLVGYNHTTTGTYVGIAQRALNFISAKNMSNPSGTLSCNCGTVDSIFGQKTYSAVCNFQYWCNNNTGWGSASVDGIVGDTTWTRMNWYCG